MRLPEDVERSLKAHGKKAAIRHLCRQYKMSRGAAAGWVSACCDRHLQVTETSLTNRSIAAILMAAFLVGMLLAALEKLGNL